MNQRDHNRKYEAKQRAAGWRRGPRITAEAAERLRALSYLHNLPPSEVVSRLLLDMPLGAEMKPFGFQQREGLSDVEMRELQRLGGTLSECERGPES